MRTRIPDGLPVSTRADGSKFISTKDYKMADYQYEVIMKRIQEFENELDNEHEVAIQLASFGRSVLLNVTNVGYSNPYTLIFYGFVGDEKATLIQHMSTLNFLLLATKKKEPDKPARRIGFCIEEDNTKNKGGDVS